MLNWILSRLSKCHLTATFGLLILFVTGVHWFLFSHTAICQQTMGGTEKLFVLLTAPFDITCEGILRNQILENFAPLVALFIMEFFLGPILESYLKLVFLVSIAATYIVSLFSCCQFGFPANGTSVIGISLFLFLFFCSLVGIIRIFKDAYHRRLRLSLTLFLVPWVFCVSIAVIFSYLSSPLPNSALLHFMGGTLFFAYLQFGSAPSLITICSGSKSSI